MPRPRRVPQTTRADCNGGHLRDGCAWTLVGGDPWAVKVAAQAHARLARHETVVTETALVVYDLRPNAALGPSQAPERAEP